MYFDGCWKIIDKGREEVICIGWELWMVFVDFFKFIVLVIDGSSFLFEGFEVGK